MNKKETNAVIIAEHETRRADIRATNKDEGRNFTGYVAKWGVIYNVGNWFRERIERNAFEWDGDDVHLLFNHNYENVLGRLGRNMTLTNDEIGLRVDAILPNTVDAIALAEKIRLGIIDQMSVRLSVISDEWDELDEDLPLRTVKRSKLPEVSILARGANPETTAQVRAKLEEVRTNFNPKSSKMEEPKDTTATPGAEPRNHQPAGTPPAAQDHTAQPDQDLRTRVPSMGLSRRERRDLGKFSVVRAANIALTGKGEGLEWEIHQEGKKNNRAFIEGGEGFAFPSGMRGELETYREELRQQSVTLDSGNKGGQFVQETLGDLISLFRPQTVLERAGARVLEGLVGDLKFPVQGNLFTAAWETEESEADETDTTVTSRSLNGYRLAAKSITTRQLLRQSSIDVEAMIRAELSNAAARAIDSAGINGTGTGQPQGVLVNPTVLAAAYTWDGTAGAEYDNLVNMEGQLGQTDALTNGVSYVGSMKFLQELKKARIDPGSGAFVVDGRLSPTQTANGYTFHGSNLVPDDLGAGTDESALICGDFSELLIGLWEAPVLLVDPYTLASTSKVRLILDRYVGTLVRRPESFVMTKTAL